MPSKLCCSRQKLKRHRGAEGGSAATETGCPPSRAAGARGRGGEGAKNRASAILLLSLCALCLGGNPVGFAQIPFGQVVSVEPSPALTLKRGAQLDLPLRLIIRGGYHINSNSPAEDYLIPTALSWNPGPLTVKSVAYPKAEAVKYEFSSQPLLVFSGAITVTTRFAVSPDAAPGEARLAGKLRYQACNEKMCLPPKTLDVSAPVRVQ